MNNGMNMISDNLTNEKIKRLLKEEITSVKKENAELKKSFDLAEEKHVAATRDMLKDIVSVLDAFEKAKAIIAERGLDSTEEGQKVRDRFLNVEKNLKNKLANHGVKEIEINIGDKIDDNLCSVADTEPDSSKENDTIIEVEKKGYMFRDVVIRPADVIIVKN